MTSPPARPKELETIEIPSPLAAVIFDLDGTLIDSERLYANAYEQAFRDAGLDWSIDMHIATCGNSRDERRAFLEARCGSEVLADLVARNAKTYFDLAATHRIPLREGIADLLVHLREHSITLAVVTSAGRAYAYRHLAAHHILSAFQCVITRDEGGPLKPSPEPFLAAARYLAVTPESCLVLEDSAAGIAAARAAGMAAIRVETQFSRETENVGRSIAIIRSAVASVLHAHRAREVALNRVDDSTPITLSEYDRHAIG